MSLFHIDRSKLRRRTAVAAACMLLLTPLAGWGTIESLHSMSNDVIQWTASGLSARRDFEWFSRHFQSRDLVFVSWPGCIAGDERLDQLAAALRGESHQTGEGGDPPLFLDVRTGAEMLRELTGPPLRLSDAAARRRLAGTFLGADGRTSCVLVVLSSEGMAHGDRVVRAIRETASREAGVATDQVRMAGYAVQMAAIDAASLGTLYRLSVPAGVIVLLATWWFLRSLRLTLLIGVLAAFCQALSLSLVYYCGEPMSGMFTVTPVLVFVVAVSASVHLINYWVDSIPLVGQREAPVRALRVGGPPCSLALVTTAIGVFSLALSGVGPVKSFGRYTAAAIMLSLVVLLIALPGALQYAPARLSAARELGGRRGWRRLCRLVCRHRFLIQFTCLAAMAVCMFGLGRLKTSMGLDDFFSPTSRIVEDYRWLESHVGALFPAEIVLRVPPSSRLTMNDKLQLVDRVAKAAEGLEGGAAISAATFSIEPVRGGGLRDAVRRTLVNRRLREHRDDLVAMKYLAVLGDAELWRVTVRLPSLTSRRYVEMLEALKHRVDGALQAEGEERLAGVTVVYTGLLPLVASSQWELVRGLAVSFGASVLLIAIVLMIGLRDVRLGLMSLLPNCFPIAVVFGAMGWIGEAIDVGSMMTASIGLGIAVDGTVHFLTWFQQGVDEGHSRRRAILGAYRHCGTAILQASIICGAGLMLLSASSFGPAVRFGRVICLLLAAAAVGDLVLLPAVLAGRIGKRLFPPKRAASVV